MNLEQNMGKDTLKGLLKCTQHSMEQRDYTYKYITHLIWHVVAHWCLQKQFNTQKYSIFIKCIRFGTLMHVHACKGPVNFSTISLNSNGRYKTWNLLVLVQVPAFQLELQFDDLEERLILCFILHFMLPCRVHETFAGAINLHFPRIFHWELWPQHAPLTSGSGGGTAVSLWLWRLPSQELCSDTIKKIPNVPVSTRIWSIVNMLVSLTNISTVWRYTFPYNTWVVLLDHLQCDKGGECSAFCRRDGKTFTFPISAALGLSLTWIQMNLICL